MASSSNGCHPNMENVGYGIHHCSRDRPEATTLKLSGCVHAWGRIIRRGWTLSVTPNYMHEYIDSHANLLRVMEHKGVAIVSQRCRCSEKRSKYFVAVGRVKLRIWLTIVNRKTQDRARLTLNSVAILGSQALTKGWAKMISPADLESGSLPQKSRASEPSETEKASRSDLCGVQMPSLYAT
ncbi:hypothetical protein K493DRAFT_304921 [Basidiobolus meristosporus CBS 931.73]|uniref:Uncharacterized protein n=1 Tax=Basidiobolus meristosporus CBS 931.73 TaxID=1314790 RepID=A0A1Y1XXD5_9FUNG|nr:hypothetical protein K493DRAFT_304921 [Basidiobolus meristosporus CBS 931.73]|eukprot:ORX90403.1 hypothetical protein K493DRAFT_304921 [Basidiobolus meristosporus CBS 931.73]